MKQKEQIQFNRVAFNQKSKPKRKEILMIIIPTVIVAIAVGAILYTVDSSKNMELDENYYRYYAEGVYPISQGTMLRNNDDGSVSLIEGDQTEDLNSLVLYNQNCDRIIIPTNMVYYEGQSADCLLVESMTVVESHEGGNTELSNNRKNTDVNQGFMYDGKDFYFFLEPVTLEYDGYSFQMGKFSYVEVYDGKELMAYNCENGQFRIASVENDVLIKSSGSNYAISARNDSIVLNDGTKLLLFGNPDLLDSIFD